MTKLYTERVRSSTRCLAIPGRNLRTCGCSSRICTLNPAKKLLFMGGEFGQWAEWNHDSSLDWALLQFPTHAGLRLLVGDLNRLYRSEAALHHGEYNPASFEWIDFRDEERNILSYVRKGGSADQVVAVICNFSPVPRTGYRIGVPRRGLLARDL